MTVTDVRLLDSHGNRLEARTGDPRSALGPITGWDGIASRGERVNRNSDGIFPPFQSLDARQLTISGAMSGMTYAETLDTERLIASLVQPGEHGDGNGVLTLTHADGRELSCTVHRDGPPKVTHRAIAGWLKWELPLIAPDPRLYGPEVEVQVANFQGTGGLRYPLHTTLGGVLDFQVEADRIPEVGVRVDGNTFTYPRVVVQGTFPGGFAVGFEGAEVSYVGPVAPGVPVEVDFAGHVWVGGVDQQWSIGARRWAGAQPNTVILPWFRPLSGGSGVVTCRVRAAWI